jgi:hypothetical protein
MIDPETLPGIDSRHSLRLLKDLYSCNGGTMRNTSKQPKQLKETARKAREIRRLRARSVKWEDIAREVNILKEDGSPDPGLAYLIGFKGYEPKRPEVRARLGLKELCLSCMRAFRNRSGSSRSRSQWRAWWSRLSPDERDRKIRSEYEKESHEN